MKFTREEKMRLLNYVTTSFMNSEQVSLEEAHEMVFNSSLVEKIETSPFIIGHCSLSQLLDIVRQKK